MRSQALTDELGVATMTILSKESLDFARQHIAHYFDSDFFPRPDAYEAIWADWDNVVRKLTGENVAGLKFGAGRTLPAAKVGGGYRVVHQLDLIESLVFTALAYEVAEGVERARAPADVACSYRIELDTENGSFFTTKGSYHTFTERTIELSERHSQVLITDVASFYNQVSTHRVQNAIEHADAAMADISNDIEKFLSRFNIKMSQGIPVGPSASHILAEAALIDVDRFLTSQRVAHTRYADDFRIFHRDTRKLRRVQHDLTLYLYEQHRLTLAQHKTRIVDAAEFVERRFRNPHQLERIELLQELEVWNPYTEDIDTIDIDAERDRDEIARQLISAIQSMIESDELDGGIAKTAFRLAKAFNIHEIGDAVIEHLPLFEPVIRDAVLYLDAVAFPGWAQAFVQLIRSNEVDTPLFRIWMEWHLTKHAHYFNDRTIRNSLRRSPATETRARLAVAENDITWMRERKQTYANLGAWDQRHVLMASKVLPTGERGPWLRGVIQQAGSLSEQCLAKYAVAVA